MPHLSEKEFAAAFRSRLRDLRKASRRTQAEVARLLGLELDTYGSYERRSNLPLFYLPLVASLYGVTLDWLLTGQDAGRRRLRVVGGGAGEPQ